MKWKEKCHKAFSTKPRRLRGCQISTSRLFTAVHPPGTPNALQSACKRRLPSRHLAFSWRRQIRFYSGCASLRRLGRHGSAPPRQGFHRGISVACRLRRSSPGLICLRIAKARDNKFGVFSFAAMHAHDGREKKPVSPHRWMRPWGFAGWKLERYSVTWSHAIGTGHALGRRLRRRLRSQVLVRRVPERKFYPRMSAPTRPIAIPCRLAISSLTAVQWRAG